MDLASPTGIWVSGIRIKLHFEDPTILDPQQVDDGLLKSWFAVRPHLHSIADLASDIVSTFNLSHACPHGLSLRMETFTLPPSQPVWLLKDKDIVSVTKNYDQFLSAARRNLKSVNTLSIEGLKKKAGDCNSQKEDAQESPNQLMDFLNVYLNVPQETAPTAELKKKCKRTEHEGVDEREQGRGLQLVPYTGEDIRKMAKGKKRKKLMIHQDAEDDSLLNHDKVQECQKTRKCKKPVNSNFAEVEKENKVIQPERRKNKNKDLSRSISPAVKKDCDQRQCQQSLHLSTNHSLNDGDIIAQDTKLMVQAESESKKKPSRSTLRKKAKRRWKREHPEASEGTKGQKPIGLPKELTCTGNSKIDSALHRLPACLNINEDDGEAEEEKLPIVVRPGHIRFVNDDEGEENNHVQSSVDRINWSNGMSKRQGQSWGQEKRQGRKVCKKLQETELADSEDVGDGIIFDRLPCLNIEPQVGDILAYRVVELTPSMCPELSEYRVGKVCEFKTQSGMLKLVPEADYPPLKRTFEDLSQELSSDRSFPSPYNEDGSLETQLVSLVDVRLVRAAMNVMEALLSSQEAPLSSQVQALTNGTSRTDKHENDPTEATIQVSDVVIGQDGLGAEEKVLINDFKTSIIHSPTVNNTSAKGNPEPVGKDLSNDHDLASAWQDLSEMLDRRKNELSRLEAVTLTSESNGSAAYNEEKTVGAEGQNEKTHFQNKSRSFRPRRAGALGPTMALLRAQNDL